LGENPDSLQKSPNSRPARAARARSDPLGIGLDISEAYALVDRASRRSRRVLALGPLTRAAFWECTAISDIRVQCGHVAQRVATLLKSYDAGVAATAVDLSAPDLSYA
jgi:uncharacterized NAD(P)/FAD-binding protein YdhS